MPKLSKEDVILKLQELEVKYDSSAPYNDLLALLKENETQEEKPLETPKAEEVEKDLEKERNPFLSFERKTPSSGKAMEMRKKLMAQVKVPIFIPLGNEEKIGATHPVCLNGYNLFIRKGEQVMVPLQVAQVLQEKFDHQKFVREHPLRVSGSNDIKLQSYD